MAVATSFVCVYMFVCRREDNPPFLDGATKYNPMFESDLTTGYSHYYQQYPRPLVHRSTSAEASTEFSSEEIQHIYENSELTKEVRGCECMFTTNYFVYSTLEKQVKFSAKYVSKCVIHVSGNFSSCLFHRIFKIASAFLNATQEIVILQIF